MNLKSVITTTLTEHETRRKVDVYVGRGGGGVMRTWVFKTCIAPVVTVEVL